MNRSKEVLFIRCSKELHDKIVRIAAIQKVSINKLLLAWLTERTETESEFYTDE